MIVGLCGLARAGKDTFFGYCKNLQFNKNPNIRHAFADKLKEELDLFLRSNFSISSFTEDAWEKEVIRPILVSYGMQKRFVSQGLYWINKVENEIQRFRDEYNHFITDVRFPNEIKKIKEMGGICIYINKNGNNPANKEEAENDPLVRELCDYHFEWEDFSKEPFDSSCIDSFLKEVGLL